MSIKLGTSWWRRVRCMAVTGTRVLWVEDMETTSAAAASHWADQGKPAKAWTYNGVGNSGGTWGTGLDWVAGTLHPGARAREAVFQ